MALDTERLRRLEHHRFEDLELIDPRIWEVLRLRITGVELTQAIQFHRSSMHLTDPADQQDDNAIALVAGKPMWVRVYLRTTGAPLAGVTGTLRVTRLPFWPTTISPSVLGELAPVAPGSVTVNAIVDYDTERSDIGRTLNFVLPASWMCGNLRLEITATSPDGWTASRTESANVTRRQKLRLRIVPVSYDGDDMNGDPLTVPPPTLADATSTAGFALRTMPVSSTPAISMAAGVEVTVPIAGTAPSPGGCSSEWIALNADVAAVKAADGNWPGYFYYGLVPTMIPRQFNSGCAASGVVTGLVGSGATMAHEVGHALGRPHAPCGNVGTPDATFPAYEPHDPANTPGASIGEYGLDIDDGTIKRPHDVRDFMSYCTPRWISAHNHQNFTGHPMLADGSCGKPRWPDINEVLVDPWWWFKYPEPEPPEWLVDLLHELDITEDLVAQRQPFVSITGVRHLDGRITVRSVLRVDSRVDDSERLSSDLLVQVLDAAGDVARTVPVQRLRSQGSCGGGCDCGGDDCSDEYAFSAMVPADTEPAALRIVDGDGEERWSRRRPARKPRAPKLKVDADKERTRLEWDGGTGDDRHVTIWWTPADRDDKEKGGDDRDGDDDRRLVRIGGAKGGVDVAPGTIPPGRGVLRACLDNGFTQVWSAAVDVDVPDPGPTVTVLHPFDHKRLLAGSPMRLHGVAVAADGTPIDDDRCHWSIDGDDVGSGLDLYVTTPKPGRHEVTLKVDGASGSVDASAWFLSLDPDHPDG